MSVPYAPVPSRMATPVPAISFAGGECEGCPRVGSPLVSPTLETPPILGGQVPTFPSPSTMPTPIPPLPTSPPATGVPPATPSPAAPPPSVGENPGTSFNRGAASTVSAIPARATVLVRLPADAILYAEGQRLRLSSDERRFVTPVLPAGQDFYYTFRAEYIRDGETITQSRRVAVRAGTQVTLQFTDLAAAGRVVSPAQSSAPATAPAAATQSSKDSRSSPEFRPVTARTTANQEESAVVATTSGNSSSQKNPFLFHRPTLNVSGSSETGNLVATEPKRERARITVKLPPGSVLYIDGQKNDRAELIREFFTPLLPVEQDFSYLMKIETRQQGVLESRMQKVTFRAGELVLVDFTRRGE